MAARRPRQIIFNGDSEELAYKEASSVEGFLSVRLKPLLGTQVDSISWSALAIWGDAPVGIRLNGRGLFTDHLLPRANGTPTMWVYRLDPSQLKHGRNRLEFRLHKSAAPSTLSRVHLLVDYK